MAARCGAESGPRLNTDVDGPAKYLCQHHERLVRRGNSIVMFLSFGAISFCMQHQVNVSRVGGRVGPEAEHRGRGTREVPVSEGLYAARSQLLYEAPKSMYRGVGPGRGPRLNTEVEGPAKHLLSPS
jgi:hypothetical protein